MYLYINASKMYKDQCIRLKIINDENQFIIDKSIKANAYNTEDQTSPAKIDFVIVDTLLTGLYTIVWKSSPPCIDSSSFSLPPGYLSIKIV